MVLDAKPWGHGLERLPQGSGAAGSSVSSSSSRSGAGWPAQPRNSSEAALALVEVCEDGGVGEGEDGKGGCVGVRGAQDALPLSTAEHSAGLFTSHLLGCMRLPQVVWCLCNPTLALNFNALQKAAAAAAGLG